MTGAIGTTRETRIIVTVDGVGKLSHEGRVTCRRSLQTTIGRLREGAQTHRKVFPRNILQHSHHLMAGSATRRSASR